jgi:hypothetical protein
MSEHMKTETALSLEDLFLSREFGQMGTVTSAVTTPGPHVSTALERRNRKYAAVGGVAAAVLVALGLVVTAGHSPKPGGTVASGTTGVGQNRNAKTDGPPVPTSAMMLTAATVSDNGSAGSAQADAADAAATSGAPAATHPVTTSTPVRTAGGETNVSTPAVNGPTPAPTSTTSSSGGAVAQVTNLAGTAVAATTTTASDALAATVPQLAPVMAVVGSSGGSISSLGNTMANTI